MKVACVSDIHGHFPDIEPCDLLIVAGDMTNALRWNYDESMAWYDKYFRAWLKSVPAGEVVGVAGNHDFLYERESEHMKALDLPWVYLEDEPYEYEDYKIWGSPWQPVFANWAFNDYDDERGLGRKFNWIPLDTEILVTHSPPYRIRDNPSKNPDGLRRVGSKMLRQRIDQMHNLQLHVFGHIHASYGIRANPGKLGVIDTIFVNAALVDWKYDLANDPIYLTLPDK